VITIINYTLVIYAPFISQLDLRVMYRGINDSFNSLAVIYNTARSYR